MEHDSLSFDALRSLIGAGIEQGAFSECSLQIQESIQAYTRGTVADVRVRRAAGYEVSTYLLEFSGEGVIPGFVVKVIPSGSGRLNAACDQERALLREINRSVRGCSLPLQLGRYSAHGFQIFASQLLSGTLLTDLVIGTSEAGQLARVITAIEKGLAGTFVGSSMLSRATEGPGLYYGPKIQKFLKNFYDLAVGEDEVAFFADLERERVSAPCLVSDRSPANFVMNKDQVGAYDFGLVLVGVKYEDWSWFIDDPRLKTSLDRVELLRAFLTAHEQGSEYLFHLSSIFVCIKQCALMQAAGGQEMASHYLKRARESAEACPAPTARLLIEKLSERVSS